MHVDYSGWNSESGSFSCKVHVDESRRDHAVHFANGSIARQSSEFQHVTNDWNHDGDVYSQYGAWFEFRNSEGGFAGGEFFTPVDLVQFAADAMDPKASCIGPRPIKVEGIEIPLKRRHPNLSDRIAQTEARAMHQEAERNRKMNALGIRPSNEPWAK